MRSWTASRGFEAVTVADLRWWIGRRSRQKKLARVRDLAVQNALDKAKGYTKSLGYSTFRAVAIADPGDARAADAAGAYPGGGPVMRSAMHAGLTSTSEESGPAFTLEPDRISITADVEARFEAS